MNRTVDELLAAFRFAIADGAVGGLLVGDNELARLVIEIEKLRGEKAAMKVLSNEDWMAISVMASARARGGGQADLDLQDETIDQIGSLVHRGIIAMREREDGGADLAFTNYGKAVMRRESDGFDNAMSWVWTD